MNDKYHSKLEKKISRISILTLATLFVATGFLSACTKRQLIEPENTKELSQTQPTIVNEKSAQSQEKYHKQMVLLDLSYGSISPSQKLDLYVPEGYGPFPLVVVIHGGGFRSGDKTESSQMSKVSFLLKEGYAAASINYRLSDEAIYPAQIHDAKTAVRYLRTTAEKYNLDSGHFGAWGASAGGTLAALLGTTCSVSELEGDDLGYSDQSSCIQAAVDWFGPIDILKINKQFESRDCPDGYTNADSADSNESKWVGAPIQTVPNRVFKTNPLNFIDSDDAPFYIQHGSEDCTIPSEQSRDFADALIKIIGKENVVYSEIPGATHGGDKFKTDANFKLVGDFLNNFLK